MLVTALAGLASAEPPDAGSRPSVCERLSNQALQGYKVPGRKPDSQVPFELFLGNASHRLIAYIYGARHPTNRVYYNTTSIRRILRAQRPEDSTLLSEDEGELRPDITDATALKVFEIKPHGDKGLEEGTREVQMYLLALNRTMSPIDTFSAGIGFEGEILVQFAQGQFIWRLEWCTNTPGVTQYRWTRSQERFESSAAAYQVDEWVEISEQELKKYGGWVAQAVEGMVDRRERLATFSGAIGVAIDVVGEVAMVVISTTISGERRAMHPEGKLLPFPSKSPPRASQVPLPKASGM
ncbi:MAG TPA: hypothetical protein VK458_31295 [Myxococcaceae bacterium]|nr:hypothetical protein [Myxococcaceae bacterium]